jgi:hypothetical protein
VSVRPGSAIVVLVTENRRDGPDDLGRLEISFLIVREDGRIAKVRCRGFDPVICSTCESGRAEDRVPDGAERRCLRSSRT